MNTIRQRASKGSMVVPIEFPRKGTSSSSTSHGYARRRTRRSSRIKICGYSIKKYQIIWRRIGILLMVLLFCILFYNNYLSPPGINLFSFGYWRLSHRNSNNAEIQAIQQNSFPQHITDSTKNENEYEMIDHPGFQMANQTKLKVISNEMNITRQIKVPKFWGSITSAYDPDGVREFLGYKGKYLISKEEASAIGSYYATKETIYVAVTSYRDPECLPTVEDLFARAKYPERIRVGIVDQILVDKGDKACTTTAIPCNQDPNQVLCKYSHNIDSIKYDARYMIGPTFARHVANRMYRGEYYSMQVDSHVRFVQDWDDVAIQQWKSIGNEMAVLTNYMSDIVNSIDPITHKSLRETRSMMCKIEFEWLGSIQQHIRYTIQPNNKPRIDDIPMLQPFWAAGFTFARGHFTVQVPYDQYLPMVFQGEEISMSIRAFTFGYDFYAPSQHVAFHMYAVRENKDKRQAVSNFNENEVLFPDAKKAAYIRLNSIIGDDIITSGDNYNNNKIEADNYGLGHVRSVDKFYKTFGIDMKSHKLEDSLCDFVQGTGGIESMHQKFTPQLRYDGMGIDYSRISYEHKTIVREETTIDEKELEILRERLRKRKTEK